jgi:hypothetical protein
MEREVRAKNKERINEKKNCERRNPLVVFQRIGGR